MFPGLLARSEPEERVCSAPESVDALLSKGVSRFLAGGPPKRERLAEQRPASLCNAEAT